MKELEKIASFRKSLAVAETVLKRAWNHYKQQWKREYFISKAQNPGYVTHSVCVPIEELRNKCSLASIIKL